jgi:tetratricopeptide (TPR) repeat protein
MQFKRSLCLASLLLLFCLGLPGQEPYGQITGRVTGPAGAALTGASVRATNLATNATTSAVTDPAGDYRLSLLPGNYDLTLETPGLKTFTQKALAVRAQDPVTLNIRLEVETPRDSPSPSMGGFLVAYSEFYRLTTAGAKLPDPAEIARIVENLEAHFKEYPDAFLMAGNFYVRIGDPERAIRQYNEGMAADTTRKVDYQKRIIEVFLLQNKSAQAYALNLEILQDHPHDPEARGLDASFRLDRGETDAAITELLSVLPEIPKNYVAHFNLGRAYFAKGDLEQSRRQYEAALELKPDYQPARQALAQLALRQGDPDTALKYSQQSLTANPDNGPARLMEAAALLRKGQFDEARALLEEILKTNPDQTDTLLELGVLHLAQKHFDQAEGPFRRAYELQPSNLRGLLGLAEILFQQNQPDQAVQLIAGELKKHPQRADLQKELANAEFRTRQFDKAIADYQSVLEKQKDTPLEQADLHNRIGIAWSSLGDTHKAIENLQEASRLDPANAGYLSALAQVYDNTGNRPEAVAAYRGALKLAPENAIVLNNLAFLLTQSGGDLAEALTLAQHARELLPRMDQIVDTVGWIYLKQDRTANAIEVFRDLTGRTKDNPTFHYHYAMALARKGDKSQALQELQSALKLKPDPQEEREIKALIQSLSSATGR